MLTPIEYFQSDSTALFSDGDQTGCREVKEEFHLISSILQCSAVRSASQDTPGEYLTSLRTPASNEKASGRNVLCCLTLS